ncbi:hypothetical protein Avbf_16583 [Armadillidium vulgare]|nr:hypothetical protein Avbf_16583 [Armadillidium vulgare]
MIKTPLKMNKVKTNCCYGSPCSVVRNYLDNKISKGQGEKRKLMMSLDCLIEAAKYENEMIKRTASNKYSIIEGKTLYCRLKSKPYQRKIIPHYLTHL